MTRLFPKLAWLFLALLSLAVLAVLIDERCSRHETKWAREFGEKVSEKVSDND
jgi:hypothetical protein